MDGDLSLLSLKWNNHNTAFLHIIGKLRNKSSYADATLACNGKFYPVHRLVLSTCSEYFCDIFEQTNCKNPVIVLKDVEYRNLEYLLDYMYIGEVNVKQNELASLVGAAEYLQIKGLAVPDEELTQKHKRTSDFLKGSSPPVKKKKILRDNLESGDNSDKDKVGFSDISKSRDLPKNYKSNFHEPSFVPIKCEPQSDDDIVDDFLPVSEAKINHENSHGQISNRNANPLETEKDLVEKEEPFDLSEDDMIQPGPSGMYENDQYQPDLSGSIDSDASLSQIPEEAVSVSFGMSLHRKWEDFPTGYFDQFVGRHWLSERSNENRENESYTNLGGIKFTKFKDPASGIWMYKCSICDYTSKCKRNSLRHTSTHTGEKPFECQFCTYKAATQLQVQRHMLTHSTEKKFVCELCHYRSKTKESLGKHIRKHATFKPYKCKFCDYLSSVKQSLRHHISTCHKSAYSIRPI